MQITPQIHLIHGMANQYLIIDRAEMTLIDTGMPSNTNTILSYIKSLGYQPEHLKNILITHSDSDHYGGVNSLRDITGAKVFASIIEAEAMKAGTSSREIHPNGIWIFVFKILALFIQIQPSDVDITIENGEVLPILGGLHVISSSGHTPGHLSFFLPNERILFAGDSINKHHCKPMPNLSNLTADKEAAQKSFEKQMELDPKVICCGHDFIDLRGK